METFAELYDRAVERKGEEYLQSRFPAFKSPSQLAAVPDDRWLARMAKGIFSAGFVWRVIENKWPGFEEAFEQFDPPTVAGFGVEEIEALKQDTRIVRNGQKIIATVENAGLVVAVAQEHGSFGQFVSRWSRDDPMGLADELAKRGSRLGGNTGPYMLRAMGVDTFLLSKDVIASLVQQGIVKKKPTSKRDRAAVAQAFNAWKAESGRSFNAISITLACTIDS